MEPNNISRQFVELSSCNMSNESLCTTSSKSKSFISTHSHPKKSFRFTEQLANHGFYKNNSMEAATKQRYSNRTSHCKKMKSLSKINQDIDADVQYILIMRKKIDSMQTQLACSIEREYASISIQMSFRLYRARRVLVVLKLSRFILTRWRFFARYNRRKKAATIIANTTRTYFISRAFRLLLPFIRALRKLQRKFRSIVLIKKARDLLKVKRAAQQSIRHCVLFGISRATTLIRRQNATKIQIKLFSRVVRFLSSVVRKRRLQMLKGPKGKIPYYLLSKTIVGNGSESNMIFEFLRWKVALARSMFTREAQLRAQSSHRLISSSATSNASLSRPRHDSSIRLHAHKDSTKHFHKDSHRHLSDRSGEGQSTLMQDTAASRARTNEIIGEAYPTESTHASSAGLPTFTAAPANGTSSQLFAYKQNYTQESHSSQVQFTSPPIGAIAGPSRRSPRLTKHVYTHSDIQNPPRDSVVILRPSMPKEFIGTKRPMTVYDVVMLLRDLVKMAVSYPYLVDGEIPPELIRQRGGNGPENNLRRRKGVISPSMLAGFEIERSSEHSMQATSARSTTAFHGSAHKSSYQHGINSSEFDPASHQRSHHRDSHTPNVVKNSRSNLHGPSIHSNLYGPSSRINLHGQRVNYSSSHVMSGPAVHHDRSWSAGTPGVRPGGMHSSRNESTPTEVGGQSDRPNTSRIGTSHTDATATADSYTPLQFVAACDSYTPSPCVSFSEASDSAGASPWDSFGAVGAAINPLLVNFDTRTNPMSEAAVIAASRLRAAAAATATSTTENLSSSKIVGIEPLKISSVKLSRPSSHQGNSSISAPGFKPRSPEPARPSRSALLNPPQRKIRTIKPRSSSKTVKSGPSSVGNTTDKPGPPSVSNTTDKPSPPSVSNTTDKPGPPSVAKTHDDNTHTSTTAVSTTSPGPNPHLSASQALRSFVGTSMVPSVADHRYGRYYSSHSYHNHDPIRTGSDSNHGIATAGISSDGRPWESISQSFAPLGVIAEGSDSMPPTPNPGGTGGDGGGVDPHRTELQTVNESGTSRHSHNHKHQHAGATPLYSSDRHQPTLNPADDEAGDASDSNSHSSHEDSDSDSSDEAVADMLLSMATARRSKALSPPTTPTLPLESTSKRMKKLHSFKASF